MNDYQPACLSSSPKVEPQCCQGCTSQKERQNINDSLIMKNKVYKKHKKIYRFRPPKPKQFRSSESLTIENKRKTKANDTNTWQKQKTSGQSSKTQISSAAEQTDAAEEMSMPDFSWLANDFRLTETTDIVGPIPEIPSSRTDGEQNFSLSQPHTSFHAAQPSSSSSSTREFIKVTDDHGEADDNFAERRVIEQEIQQKYAEIDELLDQINEAKRQRRRRRKYKLRKYDKKHANGDEWVPSYVSIYPIKRHKRPAQPIRNALLTRTAMKKAWSGLLGSCCGRGCWATWKWINLQNVMADYE